MNSVALGFGINRHPKSSLINFLNNTNTAPMGLKPSSQAEKPLQKSEEDKGEYIDEVSELKLRQQYLVGQLMQKQGIKGELLEVFKEVIDFYDKSKQQEILQQINKKFSQLARKDFRSTLDLATANIRIFLDTNLSVGSMTQDFRTYPIITNNNRLAIVQAAFHLEKVEPPKPKKEKQPSKLPSKPLPPQAPQSQSIPLSKSESLNPSQQSPHKPKSPHQPPPQPNTFLIFVFKIVKPETPKTRQQLSAYFQFSGIYSKQERQNIVNLIWATFASQNPKSPEDLKKEALKQALIDQLLNRKS